MKTSEVFKAALGYLWDGRAPSRKVPFICAAIEKTEASRVEQRAAKDAIEEKLYPHYTYSDFLRDTEGGCYTTEQLQARRKAWLESLIKEFEEKGD